MMGLQTKGFGISVAIHAILFFTFFFIASYTQSEKKIIALDFSIMDGNQSVVSKGKNIVAEAKKVKAVKSKPRPKPVEKKKPVDEPKKPEIKEELTPEPANEVVEKTEVIEEPKQIDQPDTETVDQEMIAQTVNVNSNSTTDNAAAAAKAKYVKQHFAYIKERIEKEFVYPRMARRRGMEGKVIVSFVICEDGTVHGIKIVESSGHKILDKNAVACVKRAAPFPPPPTRAELIFPITYMLG